jgi:DNA-binding NtrC family response regulator
MPQRRDAGVTSLLRSKSRAMRELAETIGKIAQHDVSVLLIGESGAGKDYIAEVIHALGARATQPFIRIDSGSIPPDLFESELFGYEAGAFTDARVRKIGRLELAHRGSLYFDEISSLHPSLQPKLLRVLQDRKFTRLGGSRTLDVDARIISSSSVEPDVLIAAGALRRDLLYRLNVVTLRIPPLRQRLEDLPRLATTFLREASKQRGSVVRTFEPEAMAMLRDYAWPGNIRELRNVVERAALMEDGPKITRASITLERSDPRDIAARAMSERWTLDQLEAHYIRDVLQQTRANYSRAAELLGINRKTLLEKRKKYGIE